MDHDDIRFARLFDLTEDERVWIRCPCGASVQFHPGAFPKRYRTPSDTLIYDLQYRFRCKHCNRNRGFEIAIGSTRNIGASSHPVPERVVVPMAGKFEPMPKSGPPKLTIVQPEPDNAS